jgi:16S rRNA (cytidine1402-2'-O)-methyltransferase
VGQGETIGIMQGKLCVVATPIGNLEDMTLRGLRLLKEADVIACEDTRHTRKLLTHFAIETPMVSYHEHNEQARSEELIERIAGGDTVALVSDAGTPMLSDPGYRLIRGALEAGLPIEVAPGASALLTAFVGSGAGGAGFCFLGFLPAKKAQRRRALEQAKDYAMPLIVYEAPHRLAESLADLRDILGDRQVTVARELTKLHEEFLRGSVSEVLAALEERGAVKGEITVVIEAPAKFEAGDETDAASLRAAVDQSVKNGQSKMDAIKQVARSRGVPKRRVYDAVENRG